VQGFPTGLFLALAASFRIAALLAERGRASELADMQRKLASLPERRWFHDAA
jgi:hypothetical protein